MKTEYNNKYRAAFFFGIVVISTAVIGMGFSVNNINSKNETLVQTIEFTQINPGSFLMGADISAKYIAAGKEKGWRSIFIQDEFPQREVQITNYFEISKFEITNLQYERFNPSHSEWRGRFMDISTKDNEAVVYVSWQEAVDYTKWLSRNDDEFDYRLPTEAEWEYVARAGSTSPFNNSVEGDIYHLNPFRKVQTEEMNYQVQYPFTWSNGCRRWVKWLPENCVGVEDVYPNKHNIVDVDLTVNSGLPNAFGVYNMHGGVEEWVSDWYGPYNENDTINPMGYSEGDFKVTRGGSHNNHVQHARSSNRMGSAANDKHYLLGFRIVRVPSGQKLASPKLAQPIRPWQNEVNSRKYKWQSNTSIPHFSFTSLYELVKMKEDGSHYGSKEQFRQFGFDFDSKKPLPTGPLYTHNHSPTISWMENGDILVSWFSGESEIGPELTLLASRGKRQPDGSLIWTEPAEFLKAPDRNMHSSNLLNNSNPQAKGINSDFTIHQMASVGVAGRWDKLALGYRRSKDNGTTWSPLKMVLELDHGQNNGASMQGNMLQTEEGMLIFVTDDEQDSFSTTGSLVVSRDGGESWQRRGHSSVTNDTLRIAGLHAAVIEIDDVNKDGKMDLMALARDSGKYYKGKAPMSISTDGGNTWSRYPSSLPSITSGQRFTLTRLSYSKDLPQSNMKAPILFTGFANDSILAKDSEGKLDYVTGLYAALSFDNGKTWPENNRKVISNLKYSDSLEIEIAPWQRTNILSRKKGQKDGYTTVTQTPDGMIFLTDGKIVYRFNLAWLLDSPK